jgi:hypothetical protein
MAEIQPIVPPPENALPLNASVTRNFPRARLEDLSGGARFSAIDRAHSYFRGTQDDHKRYSWDGYFMGYGIKAAVRPGWYVPFADRKPSTTIPLAKVIVGRLTSMLFGDQNRPTIQVEGDEDAEAYVRAIAKGSRIFQKFVEARNLGGACGAVAVSYGIVATKPRVEVHCLKHVRVLTWRDRAEHIPEAVLKAYRYAEEVFDEEAKRYRTKLFWYARYWDAEYEYVWERIPDDQVKDDPVWFRNHAPDRGVKHGDGTACPVVWIQNIPCSEDPDGESDYDNQHDNLDSLNRLQSSTSAGTLKNTDPTLVIKTAKTATAVKKGSETSIWAEGGADYLTLPGDAMRAATEEKAELRASILDACQVVIPSAEKLSGAAQSAAAIRLLYAPMTAKCDVLREQYGDMGIARVLEGLLLMCKAALARGEDIELPARMESDVDDETGEAEVGESENVPGEREDVSLTWPTYFPPTWTEKGEAVTAAQKANGGKPVISHRSSVEAVAQLFGVDDTDAELAAIEGDAEAALERQASEMEMYAAFDTGESKPGAEGGKGGPASPKPPKPPMTNQKPKPKPPK